MICFLPTVMPVTLHVGNHKVIDIHVGTAFRLGPDLVNMESK